jgi:serine/threonine-protein kinase
VTPLLTRPHLLVPGSWSKSGVLAFFQLPGGTARDLAVLEPGESEPRTFLGTRSNERGPVFSPDGRWIAYVADSSGVDEVYLRPYPGPDPQLIVSVDGGTEPVWSRDGRELYDRSGTRMMAVSVDFGQTAPLGRARLLFDRPYAPALAAVGAANYDVGADGRFLMITAESDSVEESSLVVVHNWFTELDRLAPAN